MKMAHQNKIAILFAFLVCMILPNSHNEVLATPISSDANNNLLIVGGSEATPHEFPWLASLHWQEGQFCSGVIISPTAVLTTVSCSSLITAFYLQIYAGLHHLSRNTSVGVQMRNPTTMVPHPEYPSGLRGLGNDLSILKISANNPFIFDEYVSALPLPVQGQPHPGRGSVGVVAGWGSAAEEAIQPQDVLNKAEVYLWGGDDCRGIYGEDFDGERMLCAGGAIGGGDGAGDFCNGDQGGPLMLRDEQGELYLAGVASWGQGCGDPNHPGVYMDVAAYLDWIQANTV